LRELALREVAESLDRSSAEETQPAPGTRPRATTSRLMVCISSFSPRAATLLRRGSRMAGRLNTDWYVVYVETPEEAPTRIDAEAQRHLLDNINKARELGAVVVRLQSRDPVKALLEYARTHRVSHILIGRSQQPWWRQRLGRTFMARMIAEATDIDLHLVALADEENHA
jgi:two-component system sensor histidine kinase KdpD